ncbi:hypothetical protein KFK09_005796 [Dendrobium nobile]|uniref:Uncharacterized protein n=1 Tax=Dendrobium nobile TaxID=94219 RepID=A0A8T3BZ97_DENNO|nr:hypothetical protein KFK09_005796 [Dendrobium nobile]
MTGQRRSSNSWPHEEVQWRLETGWKSSDRRRTGYGTTIVERKSDSCWHLGGSLAVIGGRAMARRRLVTELCSVDGRRMFVDGGVRIEL